MRRHEPLDIDAAVIRLAGDVDRLRHDVDELAALRGDVDSHSRSLGDLAEVLRRLRTESSGGSTSPTDDEAVPPPEWLTVTDPGEAIDLLCDLDQWIRDVWRHYHQLVTCWAWHPSVVAELLTCRLLWSEAVAVGAAAGALGAWHDRWRPGAAQRISRALMACERTDGAHVTGPGAWWSVDVAVLDELAVWWATTHGSTPPPGLTREERR
jgi:hypothetical protein